MLRELGAGSAPSRGFGWLRSVYRHVMARLLRGAVVVAIACALAHHAESQTTHRGAPRCTDLFFSGQAERINQVCCSAEAPTGGHRRAQPAHTCDGVPPTCESQLCASTYTEFFESCRTHLLGTPEFADYERLYSECATLAHDCDPVYLGEAVGSQRVFKWNDGTGGCTLDMAAVGSFCRDPISLATCLEHIAALEPEPEPEPEAEPVACQQVFLGPDMGFVDVMERNAAGECARPSHSAILLTADQRCTGTLHRFCSLRLFTTAVHYWNSVPVLFTTSVHYCSRWRSFPWSRYTIRHDAVRRLLGAHVQHVRAVPALLGGGARGSG